MIVAFDTSTFVAYAQGERGNDVEQLDEVLEIGSAMIPPMVLTELLSDPKLPNELEKLLVRLPLVDLLPGFWKRAGKTRAVILSKRVSGRKLRARLGDALIAQCCLDNEIPLITRDKDFRHFAKYAGLRIL